MQPVKASGWFNSELSPIERAQLIKSGLVPINDVFFDLWDNTDKLKIIYGGYGSGKSDYIATWFIKECRKPEYFKGYFGRKVESEARDSCHSKLVSVIERHGLQHEFKYSKEPTGTMVIQHVRTGNKLLPYGAQDTEGMKSVDDPTAIWMEEADQFNAEDMQILLSRLRTPKARHHLILSFNTAPVLPGHWILKYFFPEEVAAGDDNLSTDMVKALNEITCVKVFCNYIDNYFQDPEEYLKTLAFTSGGDGAFLDAIAKGAWGVATDGLMFPLSELNFFDIDEIDLSDPEFIYLAADPAGDGGDDFAAAPAKLRDRRIYIDDMIYNINGTDANEKATANMIVKHHCHAAGIEGVFGWADTVNRIRHRLQMMDYIGEVRCLKPRTAKHVRISARAAFIKKYFVFRRDYNAHPEYARFMRNLCSYLKVQEVGKRNKHDEAPDLCEMIASYFERNYPRIWTDNNN